MAERLTKRQSDKTRAAIQTGLIRNRLQDHILGKVEMTATQVRAAEILLKKTLPDLRSTEVTGSDGGPVDLKLIRFFDDAVPGPSSED